MKVAQMDKLQCELEQAHDLILMKDNEINALKSKPLSAAVDHFDTPIAEIVQEDIFAEQAQLEQLDGSQPKRPRGSIPNGSF